jgi:hypothetical protein
MFVLPGAGFGEGYETVAIARALACDGRYADAYGAGSAGQTGPTAHLPPLFPLFLAALMRFLGYTPAFAVAASAVCLAAHAVHSVLLVRVARLLFGSDRAGIWAAAVSIAVPPLLVLPQWEAIYAADGLMLFVLATEKWMSRGVLGVGCAARCGISAGILALLHSGTPPVTATWLLWRVQGTPGSLARRITFLPLAGVFGALVLAPWVARNWLALGSPVILRSNLGLELAVSNNPWAAPSQMENFSNPAVARLHPTFSSAARAEIRRGGEIAYNRRKLGEALTWIRENRAAFLRLTALRAVAFWWPARERSRFHVAAVRLTTALGALGMLAMIADQRRAVWFLAGAAWFFSLPYTLVHASTRYRFPILWISLLAAGYALDRLGGRARPLRAPRSS